MFKKFSAFIITILLTLTLLSTAFAGHTDNIKDYLYYLSSDELASLQSRIDQLVPKHGLDIAIVITDDIGRKSPRDYADDYYEDNGFGIGADHSGLLLLINMGERDLYISTEGLGIRVFTDYRIDRVLDAVAPHLSSADYYNACNAFLDQVDSYAIQGIPSDQHNYDTETGRIDYYDGRPVTYFEKALAMMKTPLVYIVAGVLALFITIMLSKTSQGRVTTSKMTYEQGDSFKITGQKDLYIRQTTSKVMVNTSSSSGGRGRSSGSRSSTHRSSGGRSHGGGGRKF
ncbi:MAG TPA: TPM domain-containing protein [Bacillota bacterium]|nr:TPM domain-containing protein [Bacillota bacterium]